MMMTKVSWQSAGKFPSIRAAEDLLFFDEIFKNIDTYIWAPNAEVLWDPPESLWRLFRRTKSYSKANVQASLQSRWHYGLIKQHLVFFLLFVSVKQFRKRPLKSLLKPLVKR